MSLILTATPWLFGAPLSGAPQTTKETAAEPTRNYSVPQGDAVETLRQFAAVAGTPVLFMTDKIRGEQTNAINGAYTPAEALNRMLSGTNLQFIEDTTAKGFLVSRQSEQREVVGVKIHPTPEPMNPNTKKPRKRILSALTALLATVGTATAQNATSPNPEEQVIELSPFTVSTAKGNSYLATNATTGTRIALPLESTPLTVNVLTSDFLNDRGNTTLTDALALVPGVRRNVNNGMNFNVRGFLAGTAKIDGFADAAGARSTQFDNAQIERLEVVKGPTSVLFGFGNPGGVISLITKRPLETRRGSLSVEYGSWDRKRASLDLTGPIFKKDNWTLSYRTITTKLDSLGFRDFEKNNSLWTSGQLQLTYGKIITLRVGMRYSTIKESEAFILTPFDSITGFLAPVPRSYNTAGPFTWAHYHQYTEFSDLTVAFTKNINLRLAFSQDDHYYDSLRRVGAALLPNDFTHIVASGSFSDDKRSTRGLQADLTGSWDTPIGIFKPVIGASQINTDNRIFTSSNNTLPQRLFPIYDIAARDYSLGPMSAYLPTDNTTENDHNIDKLYYALGTWQIWQERLTLLGAIGHGVSTDYTLFPVSGTVLAGKFKVTKPQYGASFRVVKGIYVFANKSESAAINNRFPDTPEKGDSYDIGAKANFQNFSGSISYFHTKRSKIQISQFDGLTNQFSFFLSGEEMAKGVETDLQYFPTRQYQVVGSYAYLSTDVISDNSTPGRAGTPLPNAPRHQFRIWNKYAFTNGPLNRLWFGFGIVYNGKMVSNFTPSAFRVVAGSVTRWDAAIGYTVKLRNKQEIDIALNGENLTDRDYIAYQLVRGTPRSAKLNATWHF